MTHAAITENKRLGDVLTYIKERQAQPLRSGLVDVPFGDQADISTLQPSGYSNPSATFCVAAKLKCPDSVEHQQRSLERNCSPRCGMPDSFKRRQVASQHELTICTFKTNLTAILG